MARVLIYEDSEEDLIRRYSCLTAHHDVHVRHDPAPKFGAKMFKWKDNHRFQSQGFNITNFREGYHAPDKESADVYFLDGLNGYCFDIINKLPKERAFIYTDDDNIQNEARQKGFNIVTESVDSVVEKISRSEPRN